MSDLDSDGEAQAMAAAMGFSSFGAAPAKKKRKFNPTTDSFVEGDQLERIDRGGKKGKGSGGNMIPLGRQRIIGQKLPEERKQNEDEIDLDLDEEEIIEPSHQAIDPRMRIRRSVSPRIVSEEQDGPLYMDTSEAAPTEVVGNRPTHLDPSLPPPRSTLVAIPQQEDAEAVEMQARIDSILASIQPPPDSSVLSYPPTPGLTKYLPQPSHNAATGLPARPAFTSSPDEPLAAGRGRNQWSDTVSIASHSTHGRGRGGHNPTWYVGYYDPNFNENPWSRLEEERGLGSVGTWLEKPTQQKSS